MASVVISRFIPFNTDGQTFLITGTVDGNAWQMAVQDNAICPGRTSPSSVADVFGNDYYLCINAITQQIIGHTITFSVLDGQSISVVFSGTPSTCFNREGYDKFRFTGAISSTDYHFVIDKQEFLNWAYGSQSVSIADRVARGIYANKIQETTWGDSFTATFGSVVTTTSSTSTTTTSTTTTTTTTTTT